jgi:hypothetical protein
MLNFLKPFYSKTTQFGAFLFQSGPKNGAVFIGAVFIQNDFNRLFLFLINFFITKHIVAPRIFKTHFYRIIRFKNKNDYVNK